MSTKYAHKSTIPFINLLDMKITAIEYYSSKTNTYLQNTFNITIS